MNTITVKNRTWTIHPATQMEPAELARVITRIGQIDDTMIDQGFCGFWHAGHFVELQPRRRRLNVRQILRRLLSDLDLFQRDCKSEGAKYPI